jgi:hypothetical protein
VLDCANGYQKEKQEETDEIEEKGRQEVDAGKKTGAEAEDSQEIGEAGVSSEKSGREKKELEEDDQQEERERA